MPYRINPLNGKEVQILKGKTWKLLRRHPNSTAARKHLAALRGIKEP